MAERIIQLGDPPPSDELGRVRSLVESLRAAGERGWLSKDEFLLVCERKSKQRIALARSNDAWLVEEVTRLAFTQRTIDPGSRVRLLCSLQGVGIPRASALLSWTRPEEWPVIDRRAWATLNHLGLVWRDKRLVRFNSDQNLPKPLSISDWTDYVAIISEAQLVLRQRGTLRSAMAIDQWLYACDLRTNRDFLI